MLDTQGTIFDIGTGFSPGPLLHSIDQLEQEDIKEETVIGFTGARIIYANYRLLQHDFPQLTTKNLLQAHPRLQALTGAELTVALRQMIDKWVLQQVCFMSVSQAQHVGINSPIPFTEDRTTAWRPPRYGRALVFSTKANERQRLDAVAAGPKVENRLIDVKGGGLAPHRTPTEDAHGTGLLSVYEALVEVLNETLIQRIFRHSQSQFQTIPIYAVLDAGFDICNEENDLLKPAGLLVRRAHVRPTNPGGLGPYGSKMQKVQLAVELLLRKYGISSVNMVTTLQVWKEDGDLKVTYGKQDIDFLSEEQQATIERVSHYKEGMDKLTFKGVNVQHTRDIGDNLDSTHLVDFGTYRVYKHFPDPILSLVSDKLLRWGGSIWPHYKEFVQPDPAVRIPFASWGEAGDIWGYTGRENRTRQDTLCEGLARSFRNNELSRQLVLDTLNIYLNAAVRHWQK